MYNIWQPLRPDAPAATHRTGLKHGKIENTAKLIFVQVCALFISPPARVQTKCAPSVLSK